MSEIQIENEQTFTFTMLHNDCLDHIKCPYDLAVYVGLCKRMDNTNRKCYPSIKKLVEDCNISKPRVIKSLKSLESIGLIRCDKNHRSVTKYYIVSPSKCRLLKSDFRVNEVDPLSKQDLPNRVNEVDPNYTQLTRPNELNKERDIEQGEKYSKPKLIKSVDLQKEFFKERLQEYKDKYTRDELNEFYSFWTSPCDVTGETRFSKVLKSKDKNFVFSNRLANAKKMGHLSSPKNNQANKPKTFDEMHLDATSEATKRFAMKEYNLTSEEYDQQYNNFNRGLYYGNEEQLGIN